MKIGMIGLGGIAQKAYLPVLLTEYPEVEWHLCTRNKEKLDALAKQYRVKHVHQSVEELIEAGIEAVFIHTPTHTHGKLIHLMLENGIHVYVDKPVSEDLLETQQLYEFAEEKNCLLVAGFNRRFAPMIQKAKEIPEKNRLFIQKNRVNSSKGETAYMIYDLFIHPLDTALYLLDEEVTNVHSRVIEEEGNLKQVWVVLETAHCDCFVSVNTLAGANDESIEIHSPEGIIKINQLVEFEKRTQEGVHVENFGDWTPTLEKRGFAPIIQSFIQAIKGNGENPVTPKSSLFTHQICHQIIEKHKK